MATCKDCTKYPGNCGNHFKDRYDHINYEIAAETYVAESIDGTPSCFIPNPAYIRLKRNVQIQRLIDLYEPAYIKAAYERLFGADNEEKSRQQTSAAQKTQA